MAELLYERRDGVAWITINRPEKRNALSPEVVCRLADAWETVRDDDEVRVAVVTGAGDRAFSAGADLGLMITLLTGTRAPANEWDERLKGDVGLLYKALLKNLELDKPVIAAVNGFALAGGCELLLATDLRVASTTAWFGLSEATRGLVPAGGGLSRLSRQLPHAIAMEILLTGEPIDADTALRYGFVNRVVEPDSVLPTAASLATTIAANGPLAVRVIKHTITESNGVPLKEAFRIEEQNSRVISTSQDAIEGPRAFMEKRAPRFTGR
ncbi:MAG TPA: enoyl-CoA hydratase-related protein [Acidimicrobiales bacterium]|jgi:enoyl-CoA hydratase|nr:enoyl-CoA hydratase-related protein [Acidimicrobiales bacterium]